MRSENCSEIFRLLMIGLLQEQTDRLFRVGMIVELRIVCAPSSEPIKNHNQYDTIQNLYVLYFRILERS